MPPDGAIAAIVIAAVITITAIVALGVLYPLDRERRTARRGRHAKRALYELAAGAWVQAWRPTRADRATALRMRRDMRPWLPRRRLP